MTVIFLPASRWKAFCYKLYLIISLCLLGPFLAIEMYYAWCLKLRAIFTLILIWNQCWQYTCNISGKCVGKATSIQRALTTPRRESMRHSFQPQSGILPQRLAFLIFFSWKILVENKITRYIPFIFTMENVCIYMNNNPVQVVYVFWQVNQILCRV